MTLPLMTFFNQFPVEQQLRSPRSLPARRGRPATTRTLIPPRPCHNSVVEIAASSLHLIDPFEQVLDLIQSQSIFFKHFIL